MRLREIGTGFITASFIAASCIPALFSQTVPSPQRTYKLPAYTETKFTNGLNVVLVQDDRFPLVTARLVFGGGTRKDPRDAPGAAAAVAALLLRGTASRSARQFAEDVDSIGCTMTATARPDSIALEATALSDSTGSLLVLMSDILRSVEFPEHEVDLYRQARNQGLRQEALQPPTIAAKLVRGALFGSIDYGAPDPVTVDHLDRELLVQYRDSVFVPNNASLILIGKLPARAELMKALTYVFGGWVEKKSLPSVAPKPPEAKRRLMLVDRPGGTQAEIRVSRIGTAFGSPEVLPLLMASAIVGSSPDSRLTRGLGDTLKPGEDVHTEVSMLADSGTFTASARVRNEIAGDVLGKIVANLERISNEPVDANELATAKSLAIGSFLLSMETQQNLADNLAMMKVMNLPKDYLEGFTTRAGAVDAARIQAAAKKWMSPGDAVIVVVGDASKIRAQLEKVGPFETVRADTGEPETGKPDAAKQPLPKP